MININVILRNKLHSLCMLLIFVGCAVLFFERTGYYKTGLLIKVALIFLVLSQLLSLLIKDNLFDKIFSITIIVLSVIVALL